MKKVLATALVALMVASTVFAAFSGSANVNFGYNFENGEYGFANGTKVKFDYELGSETGEAKGEGDVYAYIKGALSIGLDNGRGEAKHSGDTAVNVTAKIKEAKVAGENWYVSILGSGYGLDFAKAGTGEVYYDYGWKPETMVPNYKTTKGVEFGLYDYKAGVGFTGDADAKTYAVNGYLKTPEYALVDGLTLQAGVNACKTNASPVFLGLGTKVAYAADKLSVSAATDVALDITKDKVDVNADAALDFAYDFVTTNVFYATKTVENGDNLLSAVVGLTFDPVAVTVSGNDLLNKQNLGVAVEATVAEGVAVNANAGYGIADKLVSVGAGVDYEAEKFSTGAAVGYKYAVEAKASSLNASAYVSTTALIPGAKLGLTYGEVDGNNPTMDLLNKKYGKLTASCSIAF